MKQIRTLQYKLIKTLRAHQVFVVLMITLSVLLVAFLRVQALNNIPVSQDYIDEKLLEIKTVKFNQSAIESIKSLRDSNVIAPGTSLPENRQNPFSE